MNRLLLLLLFPFLGCAPSLKTLQSFEQIEKLRLSVLLVRLDWPAEKLALKQKYGQAQKADKIETRYAKRHQKIAGAFEEFRFCEVYFFYADPAHELASFEVTDFLLHDRNLQSIDLKIQPNAYFIGQFTTRVVYKGNENGESVHGFEILPPSLSPPAAPFPGFEQISYLGTPAYYKNAILRLEKKMERLYQKNRKHLTN